MVTVDTAPISFWNDDDLFFPILHSLSERFDRLTSEVNDYLKPNPMLELVSSFAEVLNSHTPNFKSTNRWKEILRKDPHSRRQMKQIHLQELSELKCKQTLLRETASSLMDAFRRCLNGSYGKKVQEELDCLSPAICSTEGLLRILCVDAVFQKETLSNMKVFSSVTPAVLSKMRRCLQDSETEDVELLILGEQKDAVGETLNEVVKQAAEKLSFLDLSKERMRMAKRTLINGILKANLSREDISRIESRMSQGSLDRSIEVIGRCPPQCDLDKPCATTLMELYEMMTGESESTLREQAEILLFARGYAAAIDFAKSMSRPETRELYLLLLVEHGLSSIHSEEILKGVLLQLGTQDVAFMSKLGKRLHADEKTELAKLIRIVVDKRHRKIELLHALNL